MLSWMKKNAILTWSVWYIIPYLFFEYTQYPDQNMESEDINIFLFIFHQ